MPPLPGKNDSCWSASAPATGYPSLQGEHDAETVIVGAGIVGLTAALALCRAGRKVVVLEARRVGRQVTGRSTAKITTQHALIYRHLIDRFGLERARLYAEANRTGVEQIRSWTVEFTIRCDLEERAAYAYANGASRHGELEAEVAAARQVGLEAELVERAPLPFDNAGAVRFPEQYQFNAASYLVGLAAAVEANGGQIFEHSRARAFEEADRWAVTTPGGRVTAENVVVATNITVKSPVGYATRTLPRSHTAMAFRADDPRLIDGMFISVDQPVHSLRMGRDHDGPLLVALGDRFRTGHDGDVASRFWDLERWVRANFEVGEAVWRWCNEDYDTADRVPYVGAPDPEKAPGYYIATGFNAWGISNGTAAGMLIAGQITRGAGPWDAVYDPIRPYPDDYNPGGDSHSYIASVDDLPPDMGGIVKRGDEKLAVWRDARGDLHALSANCTHKGCIVTWNTADRTWDCPCHGSIFEADGSVIHGPAREPLPPRSL